MKKVFTKRALIVVCALITFGMMALKANPTEGIMSTANTFTEDVINPLSPRFTPTPLPTGVSIVLTTTEPLDGSGVASFDTVYYGTTSTKEITYTLTFSGAVGASDLTKIYTFSELSLLISATWEASQFLYFPSNFENLFRKTTSLSVFSPSMYAMYDKMNAQAWVTANAEQMLFGTSGVYSSDTLDYYYVTGADIDAGLDIKFRYTPSSKNYTLDYASFTIASDPATVPSIAILHYESDPNKRAVYQYFTGTNGYPEYPAITADPVQLKGWGKEPFITIECADLVGNHLTFDSVYYGYNKNIPAIFRAEGLGSRDTITFAELYLLMYNKGLLSPNANNPFNATDLISKFYHSTPRSTKTGYNDLFGDVLTRGITTFIPGATIDSLYNYYVSKTELEAGINFNFAYTPPSIDSHNLDSLRITTTDPQSTPIIAGYQLSYPEAYAIFNNYPRITGTVGVTPTDIYIVAEGWGKPGKIYLSTTPSNLTPEGYCIFDSTYHTYTSPNKTYTIKGEGLEPGKYFTLAEMIALWADHSVYNSTKDVFPSDFISYFDHTGIASPFDISVGGVDSVLRVYFQQAFTQAAKIIWGTTTGHTYADLQYYYVTSAELLSGISINIAYTPSAAYKVTSYSYPQTLEPVIDSALMKFVDSAYNATLIKNLLHSTAGFYDTAIYNMYRNYPTFDVSVGTVGHPKRAYISIATDSILDADGYYTFLNVPFGCTSDSVVFKIYAEGVDPSKTFTYVELAFLMADQTTSLSGEPFVSNYIEKFKKLVPLTLTTQLSNSFKTIWDNYPSLPSNLFGSTFVTNNPTKFDTLAYYYVTGLELLNSIEIKIAYSPSLPNHLDSAQMLMVSPENSLATSSLMNLAEPARTFYRNMFENYPEMINALIGTKGISLSPKLTLTPHESMINDSTYDYYDFGEVYYGHNTLPRDYVMQTTSVSSTCVDKYLSFVEILLLLEPESWQNYTSGDPFKWSNLQSTFVKTTQMSTYPTIWMPGHDTLFNNETLLREAARRIFGSIYESSATKAQLADTLKYYYVTNTQLNAGILISIQYSPTSTKSVDSARMVFSDPRDLATEPFMLVPQIKAIYDSYPEVDSVIIAVKGTGKPPVIKVDPKYPDTTHFGIICKDMITAPVGYTIYGLGFVGTEIYSYAEWLPLMQDSSTVTLDGTSITSGDPFPSNYDQMFRYVDGDVLNPKPEMPTYAANQTMYDALFAAVWNEAAPRLGLDVTTLNYDTLKYWYVSGKELLDSIDFNISFEPENGGYYYAQMGLIEPDSASSIKILPDTDIFKMYYRTNYPVFDSVIIQVDGYSKQIVIADYNGTTPVCDNGTLFLSVAIDSVLTDGTVSYNWSSPDYPYPFITVDTNKLSIPLQMIPMDATYHFQVTLSSSYGCIQDSIIPIQINKNYFFTDTLNYCYYNLPLNWRGQIITTADVTNEDNTYYYYDSLQRIYTGCDSVFELVLNIYREYDTLHPIIDEHTICINDTATFTWEGKGPYLGLTVNEIFYDTVALTTINGCDSIRVLRLEISEDVDLDYIIGPSVIYRGQTLDYAVIYRTKADYYLWSFVNPVNPGFIFISSDSIDVPTLRVYSNESAVTCSLRCVGITPGCGSDTVYYEINVLNQDDESITIIPSEPTLTGYHDFGNVYYQHTAGPATFTIQGTNVDANRIVTFAELLILMNDNTTNLPNEPFTSDYIEKLTKTTPAWTTTPAAYDSLFKHTWTTAGAKLFGQTFVNNNLTKWDTLAYYYVTGPELNAGVEVNIWYTPSSNDTCERAVMEIENPLDAFLVFYLQENDSLINSIFYDYPIIHDAIIEVRGCGTDNQPIIKLTPNDFAASYNFGDVYYGQISAARSYTMYGENLDTDRYFSYVELGILMSDNSIIPVGNPFPSNYIEKLYHIQPMPVNDDYIALFNNPTVWNYAVSALGIDPSSDHMILAHYYLTGNELLNGVTFNVSYQPQVQGPHNDVARMEMENPIDASGAATLLTTIFKNYPYIDNVIVDVIGSVNMSFISITPQTTATNPYDFGGVYFGSTSDSKTFTIYGEGLDANRIYTYAELAVLMNEGGSFGDNNVFINNVSTLFHKYQPMSVDAAYNTLFTTAWAAGIADNLGISGGTSDTLKYYYVTGSELMAGIDVVINYHPLTQTAVDAGRISMVMPGIIPPAISSIFNEYPEFINAEINVAGHAVTSYITVTPQTTATNPYDFGGVYFGNTSDSKTFTIYGEGLDANRIYTYAELAVLMNEGGSFGDNNVFINNVSTLFHKYQPMSVDAAYNTLFTTAWAAGIADNLGISGGTSDTLKYYYVTGSELMAGIDVVINYHPLSQAAVDAGKISMVMPGIIPPAISSIFNEYPEFINAEINVAGHAVTSYITVTPQTTTTNPYDFGGVYFGSTSDSKTFTIYGEGLDANRIYTYAELAVLMNEGGSFGNNDVFINNVSTLFHKYQPMSVDAAYNALFTNVWAAGIADNLGIVGGTSDTLKYYYVTGSELMTGIDVVINYKPLSTSSVDMGRIAMIMPGIIPPAISSIFNEYPDFINAEINVAGHANQPVISITPNTAYDFGQVCYGSISDEVATFTISGIGLDPTYNYTYAELALLIDSYMNYTTGEPFPSNFISKLLHTTPLVMTPDYDALFSTVWSYAKVGLGLSGTDYSQLLNYYVTGAELIDGIEINIQYTPTDRNSSDTASLEITNNITPYQTTYPTIFTTNYPYFNNLIFTVVGQGTSPDITFYGDFDICLGESTVITAVDMFNNTFSWYRWQHSNENTSVITVTPTVTTTYYLEVINSEGCYTLDSVTVVVNPVYKFDEPVVICQSDAPYIWAHNGVAYYTTGIYEYNPGTVAGCDSLFVLNLTVNPTYTFDETLVVCDDVLPYEWHGLILTASGNYTAPFLTVNGCDSIYNIDFTVNPTYDIQIVDGICEGENYNNYNFNLVYPRSGVYTQNLLTVDGCDSIVTLTLTVNPVYVVYVALNVCDSYDWNGTIYTRDGVYTQNFLSVDGCDSTVILVLHVDYSYYEDLYVDICDGQTYDFCGNTYSTSIVDTCQGVTVAGCDHVVTLHLTVHPLVPVVNVYREVCEGEIYLDNDFSLVAKMANVNILPNIISDTATITTWYGCDSVRILYLTVIQPIINVLPTVNICQGEVYNFNGQIISSSGLYSVNLNAVNGCDSIVQVTVNVHQPSITYISHSACDSYDWFGTTYTQDGVYAHTTQTIYGCDSTIILALHINHSYYNEFTVHICEGESYTFCGQELTTTTHIVCPLISVAGCDSITFLHLIVHPTLPNIYLNPELCEGEIYQDNDFTVVASMTNVNVYPNIISDTVYLTTQYGCDSIRILNLKVLENSAVNILPNVNICMGDLYEFYGQQITTTGVYTALLTANNGCDSVIQVSVTVYPIPIIIIEGNTTICSGESTILSARPFTGPNSYYEYLWIRVNLSAPNDTIAIDEPTINTGVLTNNGSTPITFIYIASVKHTLTGCIRETSVIVTVNPLPINASIVGPTQICEGEEVVLTATGAQSYIWTTGQTGSTITITPTVTSTIGMRATNSYGCSTPTGQWIEHTITVNVAPVPVLVAVGESYTINLSWNNTNANEYWIYRDNSLIAITTSTSYIDEQIIQGLPYCYTVVGVNSACVSQHSNQECTRSTSVAIPEEDALEYNVYPNPTSDFVTVQGENIKTVSIFNTLGQKLVSKEVNNESKVDFEVANYESSMYIIRIETINGNIITKRLVVVR